MGSHETYLGNPLHKQKEGGTPTTEAAVRAASGDVAADMFVALDRMTGGGNEEEPPKIDPYPV